MNVTVTADWHYVDTNTKHVAGYKGHRIEIAGYTAAVEEIGPYVFEFTVLQDHLRIVEVGQRHSLDRAKWAAEQIIENDILGVTV